MLSLPSNSGYNYHCLLLQLLTIKSPLLQALSLLFFSLRLFSYVASIHKKPERVYSDLFKNFDCLMHVSLSRSFTYILSPTDYYTLSSSSCIFQLVCYSAQRSVSYIKLAQVCPADKVWSVCNLLSGSELRYNEMLNYTRTDEKQSGWPTKTLTKEWIRVYRLLSISHYTWEDPFSCC